MRSKGSVAEFERQRFLAMPRWPASQLSSAFQTEGLTDPNRPQMVHEEPTGIRPFDRPLDHQVSSRPYSEDLRRHVQPKLSLPMADQSQDHTAKAETTGQAAG